MLVMGLDVASVTGWALHDTDRPPSAIICGSFRCDGKTAFDKVSSMRAKLPLVIRKHRPDFVAIEAPLTFIKQHKTKKRDMLGEHEQESTINPHTVFILNRLAASAQTIVEGFNIRCCEVAPRSWQANVLLKGSGSAKERAKATCEALRIEAANADQRDACLISIWAANHSQALKIERMIADD
jgi:predicted nuclease with RNAse H fold